MAVGHGRARRYEAHYKANLRDIEFNLLRGLRLGCRRMGTGPFAEMDIATAHEILAEVVATVHRGARRFLCLG
jgi:hypothetical protein